MLKHGILGLLNYSDQTGYEIMEVFRDSLQYFWTANTSQIYRELQGLKAKGFVTDTRVEQAGRPDKNVFRITPEGREELKRWLRDGDYGRMNNGLLMKVFFSGELPREENIAVFRGMEQHAKAHREAMEQLDAVTDRYEKGLNDRERALYWKMTASFGKKYAKMMEEWSAECARMLEEEKA